MSLAGSDVRGYEKVKTVGKGSFGTATLYRRLQDDLLVVMKEILVSDMSQSERSAALNEVEVLAALRHPNIIEYLGSFEHRGSLMIVMEYADGGNLAQFVGRRHGNRDSIPETEVLDIFAQICSGIGYMHANKILHRDMKSANVFLTRGGEVKIGDFGISKMMNTRSQAHTVVGTPYYLSPEMCEGKDYNEKSDIWAMGCVLYELVCLRRPFEAPSLPLLIQKISSCDFPRIPDAYSDGIFHLIESILQRDSERRPSALVILHTVIPSIRDELKSMADAILDSSPHTALKERSVLYELEGFADKVSLRPMQIPVKGRIVDMDRSSTHYVAVTEELTVHSWGEEGVGKLNASKIVRCGAGDGFTILLTEDGALMTSGSGKHGCLGHGNWTDQLKPKIIESLRNVKIATMSCGARHVLALAENGRVFSWGSAQRGQLGLGHSQHCCKPMALKLPEFNVRDVFAGDDCSALLSTAGKVFFSGSSAHGKLGVRQPEILRSFAPFDAGKERFRDVAFGPRHTVLLSTSGSVHCLGSNSEGQCGKPASIARILVEPVERITAGITYTAASTRDNVVYFWGSCSKSKRSVALEPKPVLALYASRDKIKSGNILWIGGLAAKPGGLDVLVHTTAPRKGERAEDASSRILASNWTSSGRMPCADVGLMNTPFH